MRIEIAGLIASGKTTLVNLLKTDKAIFEDFKSNTYLSLYYKNPAKYVFETEFSFLFQHYHQIKKSNSQVKICDFALLQDLAYGKMGLGGNKLLLFTETYNEIIKEINWPDVLVFLSCDVSILKERIKNRGRENENDLDILFLLRLQDHLSTEIDLLDKTRTKVININTGQIDLNNIQGINIKPFNELKAFLD
jgi:deoxyadenosine/deoxycytidine kinase